MAEPKADLTTREKIVLYIMLWIINILAPWQYDHQQKEYIESIKKLL